MNKNNHFIWYPLAWLTSVQTNRCSYLRKGQSSPLSCLTKATGGNESTFATLIINLTHSPVENIPTVNTMHAHDRSCNKSIEGEKRHYSAGYFSILQYSAYNHQYFICIKLKTDCSCADTFLLCISVFAISVHRDTALWLAAGWNRWDGFGPMGDWNVGWCRAYVMTLNAFGLSKLNETLLKRGWTDREINKHHLVQKG